MNRMLASTSAIRSSQPRTRKPSATSLNASHKNPIVAMPLISPIMNALSKSTVERPHATR